MSLPVNFVYHHNCDGFVSLYPFVSCFLFDEMYVIDETQSCDMHSAVYLPWLLSKWVVKFVDAICVLFVVIRSL